MEIVALGGDHNWFNIKVSVRYRYIRVPDSLGAFSSFTKHSCYVAEIILLS
ncbi:MAG: hypothetical protein QXG66_04775 [Candidatus Bathyarchaeia archaeon]